MTRNLTVKLPAALAEDLLSTFPELIAVYRFGSYGTEHERPESDLDECCQDQAHSSLILP
ncbi:hypothetical protein BH20ACT11_BH20ACT11_16810 [soil metagenome]